MKSFKVWLGCSFNQVWGSLSWAAGGCWQNSLCRFEAQDIAAFKDFKMTTHIGSMREVKYNQRERWGFSTAAALCDISNCKHIGNSLEEYLHVSTHLFPSLHLIISAARDSYTASSAEQIENSPWMVSSLLCVSLWTSCDTLSLPTFVSFNEFIQFNNIFSRWIFFHSCLRFKTTKLCALLMLIGLFCLWEATQLNQLQAGYNTAFMCVCRVWVLKSYRRTM